MGTILWIKFESGDEKMNALVPEKQKINHFWPKQLVLKQKWEFATKFW